MDYSQEPMCCLCLNTPELNEEGFEKSIFLNKLTSTLTELANVVKQLFAQDNLIFCPKCCSTVEMIYNFNIACLQNIKIYSRAISKVRLKSAVKVETEIESTAKAATLVADCTDSSEVTETKNKVQISLTSEIETTLVTDCADILKVMETKSEQRLDEESVKNQTQNFTSRKTSNAMMKTLENLDDKVSETSKFQCNFCSKVFGHKHHLRRHENVHSLQENHICESCGKSFRQKDGLRQHMSVHTAEKSFVCHICGKGFNRKDDLNQHNLTHTGDKPYCCEMCGIAFRHRTSLARHKLVHTGEKPFRCDTCSKGFIRKKDLNDHKLIHTGVKPYSCNYCNQTFRLKHCLVKHIRIHTGEKPYMCDVCSKTFTERSHLVRHSLTHSNAKPYSCEVCFQHFKSKPLLNKHKCKHPNESKVDFSTTNFTFNQKIEQQMPPMIFYSRM